jgi:hypothetical protein
MIVFGVITLLILGIVLYSYAERDQWKNKMQEISKSRPYLSRAEYISILEKKGFNVRHIEVVYDRLYEFIALNDFSMYPEDDIHKLYGIHDLDDVELIDQICKRLNLQEVDQKDCDELNKQFDKLTAEYILTLTKILENKKNAYNSK